jgi:hypothetical protein
MVNFIVRYVVRYFENLETAAISVMRPMAWLAFVAACTPLVIGSCVVLSGVISDQREMYDASLNWLCAVGIFPWVAIGLATTVLMLVNIVFTAVTLESESKFD